MHPVISICHEEQMTFLLFLFVFVIVTVIGYFEHLALSDPLLPSRAQVCSPAM